MSIFALALVALTSQATAAVLKHDSSTGVRATGAIPASITEGLQNVYRITIVLDPPALSPRITADQAILVSRQNFPWASADPASAHFVAFTDLNSGTLPPHPDGVVDGLTVVPKFVNTPAWLVILPNSTIPLLGSPTGASYTASLCVFVDASTGAFLKAVTVTTSGANRALVRTKNALRHE